LPKKIMLICKDLGSVSMVGPIAQALSNHGYEALPIIEGMGASRWSSMCQVSPVFRGTDDFRRAPFSLDASAILNRYSPNVVVVGESSPNNLEGQFARVAQKFNIPLVLVEDFWGGFVRISGLIKSPDLVLTLDQHAAGFVQTQFPDTHVVVTGNPGVRQEGIVQAREVLDLRARGHLVITFCGGGPETAEQLQLLLQCLSRTSGEWVLIPRWHPKEADRPDAENGNQPYRETWDTLLEPLGSRVVRFDKLPTDNVLASSDVVCAGYSTTLTTAAYVGVTAVSLVTPEVKRLLMKESGLSQVPQVALRVAHAVDTPVDLAQFQPCSIEVRARLMPFDSAIGAAAVNALVNGR